MKAIGYKVPGPIAADAALVDINLPRPVAAGYDILVEVKAVSVNPVDYKVRNSTPPADGDWKVLGWDAAGIVREVGPDVTQFELGDEVYYAGSITRPGTNAEFHLVDARIVGHKPASLSWAEAAALPLTTLTAWEAMFDRLDVAKPVPGAAEAILIIGAPAFVFSTTHTEQHVADIAELIAPQGRFGLIDDPKAFDIMVFKRKAVSIHHELMFTRSIYGTPDMNEQGEILDAMAALVGVVSENGK